MSEKITWDKAGFVMGAGAKGTKVPTMPQSIRNATVRSAGGGRHRRSR